MLRTRPAAVAGLFYPDDPGQLAAEIDRYLDQAPAPAPASVPPCALIVPHAGVPYSGPVAASAYRLLRPWAEQIHSVVILGPSHHLAFQGLALPDCEAFETPLGRIEIDQALAASLQQQDVIALAPNEAAHRLEHCLEVQLPFLQRLLKRFRLLPLLVGEASSDAIAEVLARLPPPPGCLLLISTDLSHYHPYEEAQRIDADTSQRILALRPGLVGQQACGCRGLNGLLTLARRQGLSIEQLDLRNSGDTAGSRDRVVGYGAYLLH
ncbi:AmmeMemoRadiSam system protein B [Aestuariirhabdus litorea]|uniref:MEMO1 family protein D0544_15465 n=1 Tax=Aestuariirhabdus litorea TaxID=2528527 RepID=A0A3P3VKL0_9GAMM|nr:AmmeMemoRadiSam system protein B [Aestuariirhabdus litorea]RRJ83230.1 AmmeMemoRadiSam system protein B [Aestuariirhabdus litorea]RWW93387.1 AmmeMemoRadiSam system protein B [Endozoicomonadaceae bacterium GTF-13]